MMQYHYKCVRCNRSVATSVDARPAGVICGHSAMDDPAWCILQRDEAIPVNENGEYNE